MKKSILILNMEQVKSDLVEMWADTIVNDRALVRECIIGNRPLNGPNGVITRDLSTMMDDEIAELYAEYNLGEKHAAAQVNAGVELVFVKVAEYDMKVVWDIDNLLPNERAERLPMIA